MEFYVQARVGWSFSADQRNLKDCCGKLRFDLSPIVDYLKGWLANGDCVDRSLAPAEDPDDFIDFLPLIAFI